MQISRFLPILFPSLFSVLLLLPLLYRYSTAMPSKAILLALLAAPCVVESAAAFGPKELLAGSFNKKVLQRKPLTNKNGLLALDAAKCDSDMGELHAEMDGIDACIAACTKANGADLATNMAGGKSSDSCLKDASCVEYKAACEKDASGGFWYTQDVQVFTMKDSHSSGKESTNYIGFPVCFPSTCEGYKETGYFDDEDTIIEKQADGGVVTTRKSDTTMVVTQTITIEEMPEAGVAMYVVIVLVLVCCGAVYYKASGGKKDDEEGAVAPAPAEDAAAPADDVEAAPVAEEEAE